MKDRSHNEAMTELFEADQSYAAELLAEVVRDGNADELAILERQLWAAAATMDTNPTSYDLLNMAFFMGFSFYRCHKPLLYKNFCS